MEIIQLNNNDLNKILSNFDVNISKLDYEKINKGYINDSFYINDNRKRRYLSST